MRCGRQIDWGDSRRPRTVVLVKAHENEQRRMMKKVGDERSQEAAAGEELRKNYL